MLRRINLHRFRDLLQEIKTVKRTRRNKLHAHYWLMAVSFLLVIIDHLIATARKIKDIGDWIRYINCV
jgi:hypothetical protein